MKFKFILLFLFYLTLASSSSPICVDFDSPSTVNNLVSETNSGFIKISWENATDEPSCSGILEYEIEFNGSIIGNTADNYFVDPVNRGVGEYLYIIKSVDLVGHKTLASITHAISATITPKSSSSGGSSKSYLYDPVCVQNWSCTDWSECVEGTQKRICDDLNSCDNETVIDVSQECESEYKISVFEEAGVIPRFSAITGAVIGAAKTPEGKVTGAFAILALFSFLIIKIKKKKK